MPRVLNEEGVAVYIYPIDAPKLIHCFVDDIESEIEVEVDLDSLLVTGYGPTNKLPTGEFLLRALIVVHRNLDLLNQSWKEISE